MIYSIVKKRKKGEKMKNKSFSVKTMVAIVIGAALMFVLMRFAAIPSGVQGTNINFGIAVLAAFAAVFGPVAGFLIGFIGHALTDLSWGGWGKIWWSWVICSGLFGFAIGFFRKSYNVDSGGFGIKQCFIFNGVQIVTNVLVWGFVARTLDLAIYQEAFGKVTLQGFAAAGVNSVVVLVLGSLLVFGYSKIGTKRAG
jgi:energy-coupling factor transport system substrate-specific component